MWNLKDNAEGNPREENARIMKKKLERLEQNIDELLHAEVGINIADDQQACDVVLISTFETKADLQAYAKHEKHLEAAEFIKSVASDRKVVDFNANPNADS